MFYDDQYESVIFRVTVDGKTIFETRKPEEAVALIKERTGKGLAATLSRHQANGLQGGPVTPQRSLKPGPASTPRLPAAPTSSPPSPPSPHLPAAPAPAVPTPLKRVPAKGVPETAIAAALRIAEATHKNTAPTMIPATVPDRNPTISVPATENPEPVPVVVAPLVADPAQATEPLPEPKQKGRPPKAATPPAEVVQLVKRGGKWVLK